jgi:DNA polymerase-3 subunit chi
VTRIDFYRYADDKLDYACRLATKAYESASRLVVYSPDRELLKRFDQALWSVHEVKFVPHCFVDSPLAAETPVILATAGDALPHHQALLNLSDEWPPFFATFDRLLEIVASNEADRALARARYAFYRDRGYDIKVNTIGERKEGGEGG